MGITFSDQSGLIYVTNYGSDQVVALKEDGSFHKAINLADPVSITTSPNAVFISNSLSTIYKFDLNLNFLKKTTVCKEARGLFFDNTSGILYNADSGAEGIHIFDEDLRKLDFLNLSPYIPYSAYKYNNQLYEKIFTS